MTTIHQRDNCSPRSRFCASELLTLWHDSPELDRQPLDRITATYFRGHHELNSSERRWIQSAIYGTVRLLIRQKRLLALLGEAVSCTNLIELWRREEQLDTATDTEFAQALTQLPQRDNPRGFIRETLSFPDGMAAALEDLPGIDPIETAQSLNSQAPTTLRVNTLLSDIARVRALLPETKPVDFSPWGLELPKRVNIHELAGFKEGLFELQEEASQLAALMTDAQPGMRVVDVGAGAGGKTLALAALMNNRGPITAIDHSYARLNELRKRAGKAKVTNVTLCTVNATTEGLWAGNNRVSGKLLKLKRTADVVLIDVPCTGSGTMRRSPDCKWRVVDMAQMTGVQLSLLKQAAELATVGGSVCYVTCAFEPEQNEDIVEAFLRSKEGADFAVLPVANGLLTAIGRAAEYAGTSNPQIDISKLICGPYLRTWPQYGGLDAFFGARLVRKK